MAQCNVNLTTGDVYHFSVDAHCRVLAPIRFVRSYDSSLGSRSVLGWNWTHNRVRYLTVAANYATYIRPFEPSVKIEIGADQPAANGLHLKIMDGQNRAVLTDTEGNEFEFARISRKSDRLWLVYRRDPRGSVMRYDYAGEGLVHSMQHSNGVRLDLDLSSSGNAKTLTLNSQGRTFVLARYEYDLGGDLVLAITDHGKSTHEFEYQRHLLTTHTNPLGGKTYFEFDDQGRCVHVVRSDKREERFLQWEDGTKRLLVRNRQSTFTTYTFVSPGLIGAEKDWKGCLKEYVYDENGMLQFVNSESEQTQTTLYFPESGLVIEQNGSSILTSRYDKSKCLIETVSPTGAVWKYEYDQHSNRTKAIDPNGEVWNFHYNAESWLDSTIDPRGYEHRRLHPAENCIVFEDDLGVESVSYFDELGRIVGVTDGRQHLTRYEYTGPNLTGIEYPDGSIFRFTYDVLGNLIETQDELGNVVRTQYNGFDAPAAVIDELGRECKFTFDEENNLTEIKNASGEVAEIAYNLSGAPTKIKFFDKRSEIYSYDARGTLSEVRDQDGELIVSLRRDETGRIVRALYPDGSETNYQWGVQGQLIEAENAACKLAIKWTPDLRIKSESVGDFVTSYEYDAVGNRKAMRTSNGRYISYAWDLRNRLSSMVDHGNLEYEFHYDNANLFSAWHCPSTTQTFEFDKRERMARRSVYSTSGTLLNTREFQFDRACRLSNYVDSSVGKRTFEYYENGALRSVRDPSSDYIEEYEYDRTSNLTRSPQGAHTYLSGDRVFSCGEARFYHDSAGRISRCETGTAGIGYRYDKTGALSSVELPDGTAYKYEYDPFGRRIRKIGPEGVIRFFWDLNTYQSECDGKTTTNYLFLPGTFLPIGVTLNGEHFSYVLDQSGCPVAYVDANGHISKIYSWQAFGSVSPDSPIPRIMPFRFQGQYSDSETGLHYNFFRYYMPTLGRYLTPDPIGFRAGANFYRYSADPIRYVDPYGLQLSGGILTIVPICGWSNAQVEEARKKVRAMNSKIPKEGRPIQKPKGRCGKTAKEIYEGCKEEMAAKGKPLPDLNESDDKCFNEQADHMLEICAGGGEKDCENLQPLNESVNKSFGSQVGRAIRENTGAILKQVKLAPKSECRENENVEC